jgi:hypothetical protein
LWFVVAEAADAGEAAAVNPRERLDFVDAESYLPVKSVMMVEVPEVGRVEQTIEFSDYRAVDGVQVPFTVKGSSPVQTFTISLGKVEHNVTVDDALFAKRLSPAFHNYDSVSATDASRLAALLVGRRHWAFSFFGHSPLAGRGALREDPSFGDGAASNALCCRPCASCLPSSWVPWRSTPSPPSPATT